MSDLEFGSRFKIYVGEGSQPVVEVDDYHFPSGMIGVRDYCDDGNRSFFSYSRLAANEFEWNGLDDPTETKRK